MFNIRNLKPEEIDVKVKQVTEDGVIALLYKTARTDMALLDEVYGPENWQCDYKDIKQNLYCGIAVKFSSSNEWIWRWDCGIESREDDGNEKKGEASDAFKRAGTRWGIGRELYTAPFIFIETETELNKKGKYVLKNSKERYNVNNIEYEGKKIISLSIVNQKGKVVYSFPKKAPQKPVESPKSTSTNKEQDELEKALKTAITIAGKEYVLEGIPLNWLQSHVDKASPELKKAMEKVITYKMAQEIKNGDEELPFK